MAQTKRIRYGVQAMAAMKQEVAIRNQVIEQLEADVQTYLSEKLRLGETNAWLTEQNDALRKEVIAANETVDGFIQEIEVSQVKDKYRLSEIDDLRFKYQDCKRQLSALHQVNDALQAEQASAALHLYISKAAAVVALVANLVLGGIMIIN